MKYLVLLSALVVWSAQVTAEISDSFGQELYESRCVECHGQPGLKLDAPIINGMPEEYVYTQLKAFHSGQRYDRLMYVMNEWAEGLTDDEMKSLARYVSLLDPCDISYPNGFARGDRDHGQQLFEEKGCVACHDGKDALRARLDRQKGEYLLYALAAFRTKIRRKPVMEDMLETLSKQDLLDLTQYFNSNDFCASSY